MNVALLSASGGALHALFLRRREAPDRGKWALPGGLVGRESLEEAARRVLATEGGARDVFLEQLYTFGAPDRDPRRRVVTVAYYALVDSERLPALDADGLALGRLVVPWEGETGGPVEAVDAQNAALPLALDHADILGMAVKRIRGKLDYTPIGFQLLPRDFTLRQLQAVHETVLGRALNKDSFRRRMLESGLLEATGERESPVEHRPAELYRFTKRSAI